MLASIFLFIFIRREIGHIEIGLVIRPFFQKLIVLDFLRIVNFVRNLVCVGKVDSFHCVFLSLFH